MQANTFSKNFEGWYLLEKMKEQEELHKQKKFQIEEVENLSFEIEKDPVDYMESMPLVFGEMPKKSDQPSTASSGSDNDGKTYVSPKATFTEEEFLEKHSAEKEEPKSEFIKYFFDKMKDKQKGENYQKKVKNLVKMLKSKKAKF